MQIISMTYEKAQPFKSQTFKRICRLGVRSDELAGLAAMTDFRPLARVARGLGPSACAARAGMTRPKLQQMPGSHNGQSKLVVIDITAPSHHLHRQGTRTVFQRPIGTTLRLGDAESPPTRAAVEAHGSFAVPNRAQASLQPLSSGVHIRADASS
jgi:hypothetical protein